MKSFVIRGLPLIVLQAVVCSVGSANGGLAAEPTASAAADNLSTQLMHCTFKITDGQTNGTAFVLSRRANGDQTQTILITVAHNFERMKKDGIKLIARKPAASESFEKHEVEISIRREGEPLWTKHPEQDVAVMNVSLPAEVVMPALPVSLLATDEALKRYRIQPGDLLRCVGFPHAAQFEANPAGFPLVRAGCLASFPLLPTKETKTFLFDFNTFEGDSGAVVYVDDPHRLIAGEADAQPVQLLLGVVTGQIFIDEKFHTIYQSGMTRHRMGLGIVIHATAIRETIALLDAADKQ